MTNEEKKKLAQIAQNTLNEVTGFTEAAAAMENVTDRFHAQAETIQEQARILAQAQNEIDNAAIGEPFKPEKDLQGLFDQVNAFIEAANDLDNASEKVSRENLKRFEDENMPRPWNLRSAIDEKVVDEFDRQQEDDLKDDIVDELA